MQVIPPPFTDPPALNQLHVRSSFVDATFLIDRFSPEYRVNIPVVNFHDIYFNNGGRFDGNSQNKWWI